MTDLENLPPEVLIIIFVFLGQKETYGSIVCVSKYFYHVCEKRHFWKLQSELFMKKWDPSERLYHLQSIFNGIGRQNWKKVYQHISSDFKKKFRGYFFIDSHRTDIKNDFQIGKKLGSGNFSTVRECVRKTDFKHFAVKIIDKSNLEPWPFPNRRTFLPSILKTSKFPGVLKVHDIYETKERMYVVEELCYGGELFDRIVNDFPDGYSEHTASEIFKTLVTSVLYLHQRKFYELNIRCDNLMFLRDDNIKTSVQLCHFFKFSNDYYLKQSSCGTQHVCFISPEQLKNHGTAPSCDMWSLGVVLYILLCGFPPFSAENTPELFDMIISADYYFPSPNWDNVSKQAKDLVRKLLRSEPNERYTPKQVLKHPWVSGYSTSKKVVDKERMKELRKFNAKRRFKSSIHHYRPRFINRLTKRRSMFKRKT